MEIRPPNSWDFQKKENLRDFQAYLQQSDDKEAKSKGSFSKKNALSSKESIASPGCKP